MQLHRLHEERLAQARDDHAPRDVIFHRDESGRRRPPGVRAPSGRVWRRYDHWAMPADTRAHMTACLRQYGVDPAAEADPTPQWRWLEVPEVAWRGWVLHHTGDILGRVARIMRDDRRRTTAGDLDAVHRRRPAPPARLAQPAPRPGRRSKPSYAAANTATTAAPRSCATRNCRPAAPAATTSSRDRRRNSPVTELAAPPRHQHRHEASGQPGRRSLTSPTARRCTTDLARG